jgi:aspartate racemase
MGDAAMTYAELDQRSNQLAHVLRAHGVDTDQPVGLCLERSIELVVALLGILKAGGAYLALDPTYPAPRLELMLQTADCGLVLTAAHLRERLPSGVATIDFATLTAAIEHAPTTLPAEAVDASADQLAYVSFTSGSTGTPKGVAVPHRAVLRLVSQGGFMRFGSDEVFLLMAPIAFDASTLELWGPLLHGGRLVIMPPGTPTLEEIGRVVREEHITTLWLTAGLFHLMVDERLDDLRGVRQLLAGGDVLSVPHVGKARRALPETTLINGYGPTENTTFTCCHTITDSDLTGGSIPIGRPISRTTVRR